MQWSVVPASMPYLLQGFRATLILSITVLATGTALGAVWGMLRVCPVPMVQRGMTALGFARRHARLITRIGGAMLVAVGVLELTGAWTAALLWIQTHWVSGYQSPL